MNFAVIGKHRDFFRKQGWIEFEELLSAAQLERLNIEIESVLARRLHLPPPVIPKTAPEKLYANGRDLWRDSPLLKRHFLDKSLAEIASELIEQKPLRFGYDQLLPTAVLSYANIFSHTIQEISCIQHLLCAALLCLSPAEGQVIASLPQKPGNAVFFAPHSPLPLDQLQALSGGLYLLLTYTTPNAVYCMEKRDPHLHHFKTLGYSYGDRLKDTLNPLVYH